MRNFSKRILALVMAGCLAAGAAGCKDKNEKPDIADSIGSLAEEDMPYGATVTQIMSGDDSKVDISIDYDYRFISEEEAVLLSNYMYALNTKDAELMESIVYPAYLSYSVESAGSTDTASYLEVMYNNLANNIIGGVFTFDYILTSDCLDETADDSETGFSNMDSLLETITGEELSGRITSRKLVTLDVTYSVEGDNGSYALSYRTGNQSMLYIYTIDGQSYIV